MKTYLVVSSSVSSKQLLCFVHGQGQKREQKHTTKNFVEFLNHSPLLIMFPRHRFTSDKFFKVLSVCIVKATNRNLCPNFA